MQVERSSGFCNCWPKTKEGYDKYTVGCTGARPSEDTRMPRDPLCLILLKHFDPEDSKFISGGIRVVCVEAWGNSLKNQAKCPDLNEDGIQGAITAREK